MTRLLSIALAFLLAPAAAQAQGADSKLHAGALAAVERVKKVDPGTDKFFKESAGYVVFPTVSKVGFIVGGGHGEGELFEGGKATGTATLTLGNIGLQAGAQEYSEIIFFQDAAALARFKQNKFEFDASSSAVFAKAGVSKSMNYRNGVAVVIHSTGGAMAEAAVGGQKFKYKGQ